MKLYRGESSYISSPLLGTACASQTALRRSGKVLVSAKGSNFPFGFKGVITGETAIVAGTVPTVKLKDGDIGKLVDGDLVVLSPDGSVSVVWDAKSENNSIFPTPSCDCRCIMCPQPPQRHDEDTYRIACEIVETLNPEQVKYLCVTGGEPTLLGDKFLDLMKRIKKRFNHAHIQLLTNGKGFSDFNLAREYAAIGFSNIVTCVSLHADIEELNDEIAGVKGSFNKTVQGLYNLARMRQRVEIRHVISKLNAHRLEPFAQFIYRNFPFAYHVALMGMEITGLATENHEQVWIDPSDYRFELDRAVKFLHRTALKVSVYNVPLCLLERKTWLFARCSISDWKNAFLGACADCSVKENCCGVFTTSGDNMSPNIKAVTGEIQKNSANLC
jgi:His-Xaa-Ser system radical SAM maturase HxsC